MIKAVENIIRNILKANSNSKDCDYYLYAFYLQELGYDINKMSVKTLLSKNKDKNIASLDSVSRCRRRLQEVEPILRGKNWYKRHEKEDEVIEEVKTIKKQGNIFDN